MNWVFLAVVIFIAYHVYDGFRRGFIRKAVSAVSLILTLAVVTMVTPHIANFIQENTSLNAKLREKCTEVFFDNAYDSEVRNDQVLMIENMQLPENIKNLLLENNHDEAYEILGVNDFREYIGAYIADMIINAMIYLISFIIVFVALKMILLALNVVTMLPLLHGMNKLAGGVLGLVFGVVLVWIAFLLVTVLCNGEMGQKFFALISESQFLTFLYNQNLISKIVFGLIF